MSHLVTGSGDVYPAMPPLNADATETSFLFNLILKFLLLLFFCLFVFSCLDNV